MVTTIIVEIGEVEGLVAIAAGRSKDLWPGHPCSFYREGELVGAGNIWFTLEGFSSVRVAWGELEVGDVARIDETAKTSVY